MKRRIRLLVPALLLALLMPMVIAQAAFASPPEPTGFVCPVLGGEAGTNGNADAQPFVTIAGGDTTIIGPAVAVPIGATNQDGAGSPAGAHAGPGDAGYTPIWSTL